MSVFEVSSLFAIFYFRYFIIDFEKVAVSLEVSDTATVKQISIPATPKAIILEYEIL
jgi:hypothetical protein